MLRVFKIAVLLFLTTVLYNNFFIDNNHQDIITESVTVDYDDTFFTNEQHSYDDYFVRPNVSICTATQVVGFSYIFICVADWYSRLTNEQREFLFSQPTFHISHQLAILLYPFHGFW